MASSGDINKYDVQPKFNDDWRTIPFEEVLAQTGDFKKLKSDDFASEGRYPVIDQGEKFISGYIDDERLLYQGEAPVVIFGDHTRITKYVDFKFAVGADGTKIFKPIKEVDHKFFYYYLKALNVPSLGYSRHYKILRGLDFPLLPLAEQKRIVAKLDSLFGHLDQLKDRLENIPVLLKQFRQAVLTQAVTGKLTAGNYQEWASVDLETICLSITDGDHQAPPQSLEGIPFLVISNVNDGQLSLESVTRHVPQDYYNNLKESRRPRRGDVLYTVTGSFGIPVLVDSDRPFTFQRHIAIIRPDLEKIYSEFLYYSLKSDDVFQQAKAVAKGTAQLTVPLNGLRGFKISLPSLKEQKEIISKIKTLFAIADKIAANYKILQEKIDHLPQGILAKAFRGELVAQKVEDELKKYNLQAEKLSLAAEP